MSVCRVGTNLPRRDAANECLLTLLSVGVASNPCGSLMATENDGDGAATAGSPLLVAGRDGEAPPPPEEYIPPQIASAAAEALAMPFKSTFAWDLCLSPMLERLGLIDEKNLDEAAVTKCLDKLHWLDVNWRSEDPVFHYETALQTELNGIDKRLLAPEFAEAYFAQAEGGETPIADPERLRSLTELQDEIIRIRYAANEQVNAKLGTGDFSKPSLLLDWFKRRAKFRLRAEAALLPSRGLVELWRRINELTTSPKTGLEGDDQASSLSAIETIARLDETVAITIETGDNEEAETSFIAKPDFATVIDVPEDDEWLPKPLTTFDHPKVALTRLKNSKFAQPIFHKMQYVMNEIGFPFSEEKLAASSAQSVLSQIEKQLQQISVNQLTVDEEALDLSPVERRKLAREYRVGWATEALSILEAEPSMRPIDALYAALKDPSERKQNLFNGIYQKIQSQFPGGQTDSEPERPPDRKKELVKGFYRKIQSQFPKGKRDPEELRRRLEIAHRNCGLFFERSAPETTLSKEECVLFSLLQQDVVPEEQRVLTGQIFERDRVVTRNGEPVKVLTLQTYVQSIAEKALAQEDPIAYLTEHHFHPSRELRQALKKFKQTNRKKAALEGAIFSQLDREIRVRLLVETGEHGPTLDDYLETRVRVLKRHGLPPDLPEGVGQELPVYNYLSDMYLVNCLSDAAQLGFFQSVESLFTNPVLWSLNTELKEVPPPSRCKQYAVGAVLAAGLLTTAIALWSIPGGNSVPSQSPGIGDHTHADHIPTTDCCPDATTPTTWWTSTFSPSQHITENPNETTTVGVSSTPTRTTAIPTTPCTRHEGEHRYPSTVTQRPVTTITPEQSTATSPTTQPTDAPIVLPPWTSPSPEVTSPPPETLPPTTTVLVSSTVSPSPTAKPTTMMPDPTTPNLTTPYAMPTPASWNFIPHPPPASGILLPRPPPIVEPTTMMPDPTTPNLTTPNAIPTRAGWNPKIWNADPLPPPNPRWSDRVRPPPIVEQTTMMPDPTTPNAMPTPASWTASH